MVAPVEKQMATEEQMVAYETSFPLTTRSFQAKLKLFNLMVGHLGAYLMIGHLGGNQFIYFMNWHLAASQESPPLYLSRYLPPPPPTTPRLLPSLLLTFHPFLLNLNLNIYNIHT
jgi:hypothetical protein